MERYKRNKSCKRADINFKLPRALIRMKTTNFLVQPCVSVIRDDFHQISEDLALAMETSAIEKDPS